MCSAGSTKRWNVTTAEAGLPGREKMSLEARDEVGEECLVGMEAKVVGFPGFMETRPKWMVPARERSMVGLRRSSSPIETPPVVRMRSTFERAVRRVDSRAPGLR